MFADFGFVVCQKPTLNNKIKYVNHRRHLHMGTRIYMLHFSFQPFSRTLFKLHRHRPQIEKVGTDGSQRGNQRLPWQGTAGSQTLKLTVPNLGTRGYVARNCRFPEVRIYVFEALPVAKAWNSWFQACNVTSGRICWLQIVGTHGS